MSFRFSTASKYENFYRYPTGEIFYLPSIDLRDKFSIAACPLAQAGRSLIVYTDWKDEIVYFLNSAGIIQRLSIAGYTNLNDGDVKRLLERPFVRPEVLHRGLEPWHHVGNIKIPGANLDYLKKYRFTENYKNNSSLEFKNDFGEPYDRETHGDIHQGSHATLGAVPYYSLAEDRFAYKLASSLLNTWENDFKTGRGDVEKKQLGEDYAALQAIVQGYSKKYHRIHQDIINKERKILNATAKSAPKVPNVKDVQFYPHQAKVLAMLKNTDTGLLDADMGAGKTLISLADALCQLQDGRATRVAIAMPNALIGQQKVEIRRFTKNTINVIGITTQTVNALGGVEAVKKLIAKAPINTIVIVSYDWLSKDKTKKPAGNYFFPNAQALIDAGIDSVTLDESHYIRNAASMRSQAILQMAPHLAVKRCMTGTLAPNTPMDIFMQCTFLDPNILGTFESFLEKYALDYTKAGKVNTWRPGAMKTLRKYLLSKGMASVRRSNWQYILPKLIKTYHKVELTDKQYKIYESILTDFLDDLAKDPSMAAALEEISNSSEGEEINYISLLAKFAPLDKFLSNPSSHPLGRRLEGNEAVGETVTKIDELLQAHFSDSNNAKVIVMSQYKDVVNHIIKHSRFAKDMIYYDAGHKGNLELFKTDPAIKILVGVSQSLREGRNLQMANRIIHVDLPWSPGSMDQSNARAYRIGQSKNVYIDLIIRDRTAEITKCARLISKRHIARKLTSTFDDTSELNIISMNVVNMTTFTSYDKLEKYIDHDHSIDQQEVVEGERIEKTQGREMVLLSAKVDFQEALIDTPTIPGESAEYLVRWHLTQYENSWYLIAFEAGDVTRLSGIGFSKMDPYYQKSFDSKAEAHALLHDLQKDGLEVTNLDKFTTESTLITASALEPIKVKAYTYVIDGKHAISFDYSSNAASVVDTVLGKQGFERVGASWWYEIGPTKSLSKLKFIVSKAYRLSMDAKNWDDFCTTVNRLWSGDLNQEFGYPLLDEALSNYTFKINDCDSRSKLKIYVKDLENAGATIVGTYLDVKENQARVTVAIPEPKQFIHWFEKTDTYSFVEDATKKRLHELSAEQEISASVVEELVSITSKIKDKRVARKVVNTFSPIFMDQS